MYVQKKSDAIVHIGTEKTGSTSIQDFLYKNAHYLKAHGFLYPFRSCGLISNHRLVLCSQKSPDPALARMNRLQLDPVAIDTWKKNVIRKLSLEVRTFQSRSLRQVRLRKPVVIYSSEHFQSRLTEVEDIARLRNFLRTMHDRVRIVVYVRRQDHMAMSAHNTSLQGGNTQRFGFDNIPNADTPYYDLLGLARRWASVFGKDAITVRQYSRKTLLEGDVAKDFANVAGITRIGRGKTALKRPLTLLTKPSADWSRFRFKRSNPRLSHTALETLLAFNALAEDDEALQGASKQAIRQSLISELHNATDEFGTLLPAREDAERFYDKFRDNNRLLASEWMGGKGFSDDFSMYPETPAPAPVIDTEATLRQAIENAIAA